MDRQNSPERNVSEGQSADQGNSVRESNNVISVLGSGRSGTSLLMQVLRELGMSTGGGAMVPASGANPEGFLEDSEIVEVHRALLNELSATHVTALPENWLKTSAANKARKNLTQIVERRLKQSGNKPWGFKDPRANNFMPLWVKIFNKPGVRPRYLVAVRDPAAVIGSLREQGSVNDDYSEMLWLRRNVEALHNTAGNCFIVHYEDWFERPEDLVRGLLSYTGLDDTFQGDVTEVVGRVVKARLNRAPRQHQDVHVNNPCVTELYEVLRECRGEDFDHARLMESVERSRRIMTAFDAGIETGPAKKTNASPQHRNSEKSEISALTNENATLLSELTAITKEVESLRANLYGSARATPVMQRPASSNSQVEKLKRELKATRQSSSYKIGWIIVSAIKKPGMNTLKAPLRLAKLFVGLMRTRSKR